MTIPEARDLMCEIAKRHTREINDEFSPQVAIFMLKSLSAFTDATLYHSKEEKDTRDIVLTLARMFMESDNMSTILAKETTDTLFGL